MTLALLGFLLPLALDSFAVAAAVGAAGKVTAAARWRITALFVLFEAGMPLLGLALGAPLASAIGPVANYVAAAAVVAVGLWMLLHDDDEQAERLASARGAALLGLGVSISLDELAIGFGLGLAHLPLVPVIVGIAAQALIATQLGLWLGARIAERFREAAERLAGVVLIVLGVVLAVEQLLNS
ncbi:manganese efflux pump [Kutzneria chonburiensis]|uniref:Manganese efflux pump n=1 Tax=Kutzneria chonburiensis TaxID=1483604 RepID=A0ABV6MRM9_9PSEU|nr:manganese efflux pump [Kutzneria chonburiensis]